jgi:hypothetical protein
MECFSCGRAVSTIALQGSQCDDTLSDSHKVTFINHWVKTRTRVQANAVAAVVYILCSSPIHEVLHEVGHDSQHDAGKLSSLAPVGSHVLTGHTVSGNITVHPRAPCMRASGHSINHELRNLEELLGKQRSGPLEQLYGTSWNKR